MHTLGIDNLSRAIGGNLLGLTAGSGNPQVVVLDKCHVAACLAPVLLGLALCALAPFQLVLLHVDEHALVGCIHKHQGLVAVGERHPRKAQRGIIAQPTPLLHLLSGERQFLFTIFLVYSPARIFLQMQQLVAPPRESATLGNHVAIILSTKVQILERELLLGISTKRARHNCHHSSNNNAKVLLFHCLYKFLVMYHLR